MGCMHAKGEVEGGREVERGGEATIISIQSHSVKHDMHEGYGEEPVIRPSRWEIMPQGLVLVL